MVAVFLPREEGVHQRIMYIVSHRTQVPTEELWVLVHWKGEQTEERRHASAMGAISQLKICPKRDNQQLLGKESRG